MCCLWEGKLFHHSPREGNLVKCHAPLKCVHPLIQQFYLQQVSCSLQKKKKKKRKKFKKAFNLMSNKENENQNIKRFFTHQLGKNVKA